jgi:hypothetical protein
MVDGEESPHAHSQAPPLDDYCHSAAPPARRESHARAMRPPIPFAGGKNGFAGTGPGSDRWLCSPSRTCSAAPPNGCVNTVATGECS